MRLYKIGFMRLYKMGFTRLYKISFMRLYKIGFTRLQKMVFMRLHRMGFTEPRAQPSSSHPGRFLFSWRPVIQSGIIGVQVSEVKLVKDVTLGVRIGVT